MKKFMHALLLSCLKATELIERKFHFQLSFREKLQLKVHEMLCGACRMYDKQSAIIEHSISKQIGTSPKSIDTEDLEKQIIEKLAQSGIIT